MTSGKIRSCLATSGYREHPIVSGGSSGISALNGEGSGPGAVLGPFSPRGAVKQEAGMPTVAQASSYCLIPPTVVHSSHPGDHLPPCLLSLLPIFLHLWNSSSCPMPLL